MGSPFAQYPPDGLQSVGIGLTAVADEVRSGLHGAGEVTGLAADQHRIRVAVERFRDEWEASVRRLGESIGDFGVVSGRIGRLAAETDGALAAALAPGTPAIRPGGPV
ncbi:hypothetical protein [Nakamurella endophytica]|uniref:Uncharacterized protein n=1 Tax=Nakamurella endophytica TaxID=1748367 RepID=A0A917SSC5_9ACTN|nr:hypothetical protein [Nakamurella endophytica]GGL96295.1 hypothetical protein GCM10011594_15020 [Nakamurella endophytica]